MNSLDISLDKNSYQVLIKQNIFKSIGDYLTNLNDYNKVFVITQKSITNIYHPHFLSSENNILFIEDNESGKTFNQASNIIDELSEKGCNKDSFIIGLGGGVVTDFTGFVASIFMRGIDHLFIPTSLLSMVDAAIGGKTALNTHNAKNTIGTIKQPKAVYIDPLFLKTLSRRDMINGYAEMIKCGLICDKMLFDSLISNFDELMALHDMDLMESMIIKCCENKAFFVEKDQFDLNERLKLNFGHTIGHGIEAYLDYKSILHGEAVYYGMIAASYISNKKGYLSDEEFKNICDAIHAIPKYKLKNINADDLFSYLSYDKKFFRNKLQFILLNNIGSAFIDDGVTSDEIQESIRYILK